MNIANSQKTRTDKKKQMEQSNTFKKISLVYKDSKEIIEDINWIIKSSMPIPAEENLILICSGL